MTLLLTLDGATGCAPHLNCGEGTTLQGGACVADESDSGPPSCVAGTRFNGLVCVPYRDAGTLQRDASSGDSGADDGSVSLDAAAPECSTAAQCTLPPDGGSPLGADCVRGSCVYLPASECVDAVDCARVAVCGAPAACQGGRCVGSPADGGTACDAGTCCGGACVELQTDPTHCGRCGLDCGLGGSCLGGACRTVVADLGPSTSTRAWLVPVQGEAFVTLHDRLIKVVGAGPASVLVQFPALSNAPQLVLGPDHVYLWATFDGGTQVIRVPRSGGGQIEVMLDQCNATALSVNSTLLMVAGNNCLGATNAIVRVPLDGGAPSFAVGGPGDFGGSALRMSLQGADVYWRGSYVQGSGIYAKSAAGSDTPRQITADAAPFGLMVDDSAVYWLAGGFAANGCLMGASLRRASLAGTGQVDAVTGVQSAAQHRHVLAGTTAYWDDCDGTVVAVDVNTGARRRVLGGSNVLGLAVDQTRVWIVERTPGNAVRLVYTAR